MLRWRHRMWQNGLTDVYVDMQDNNYVHLIFIIDIIIGILV